MPVTKGMMGFLNLGGNQPNIGPLRVTSCGLKAAQEVSAMDTIDGTYDFTAYRLGPVKIEGDVEFPIPSGYDYLLKVLTAGAKRNAQTGLMINDNIDIDARYDYTTSYRYTGCQVNTMSFSVASEEAVSVTMNLIGLARVAGVVAPPNYPSPQRVLTWNEVNVSSLIDGAYSKGGVTTINAPQIRNFQFEVNNNITPFFGLGGGVNGIFASLLAAGKREITGSMEIAWTGSGMEDYAYMKNVGTSSSGGGMRLCTTTDTLSMSVTSACAGGSPTPSGARFYGIVYNMEDISMTNDFFIGTQSWRAYGVPGHGDVPLLNYGAMEIF